MSSSSIISVVALTISWRTTHWCAFEFYLFSLSRHRDDRKQWLEYGDKARGFAIGFAPALFQPDQPKLSEKANENLHVGRVIYGDAATVARHRLVIERAAEITNRYALANLDAVKRVQPVPYLAAMSKEVIASQLVWNCLTAKGERFENEREVRYVVMNVPGKFEGIRKSLGDKDYIQVDLPLKARGNIKEVLVGPLAPAGAEAMVAALLKELGYPENIPSQRSAATM